MSGAEQLTGMRGDSRHSAATADTRRRVAGWLPILVLCVILVLAGTGPAAGGQPADTASGHLTAESADGPASVDGVQSSNSTNESREYVADNDTEAPEWVNASKAWQTELELRFTDDSAIRPESITAEDFVLSTGNVTAVAVEPTDGRNYTDVTVDLTLEEPVAVNNITVSIAANGSVADAAGNELTDGRKRVTGMDSVVPKFEGFALTRVNSSTVEIRLAANEPLSEVELVVTGPQNDRLNMTDFTPVDGSNTTFSTRYTVPEHGAYSFVWQRAVDRRGNFRVMSRMRQFRHEDPAPEVVVDGPDRTTVDTEVVFDASETVDEDGVASYRWRIDGGTVLTGPSIRVAFATAGRHDITLEVTDSEGHTAVETRQILVRRTVDGAPAVTVTQRNGTHANATVRGTGLVQQVRAENGTLVEGPNVTLNYLSAAFPANTSVSLRLRATDGRPASFRGPPLGGFEVDHDSPANRVNVRFSVDRASLNRSGVAPDEVVLYRDTDGWTPLTTSVVSRGERRVVYHATAPGLSAFAVGADNGTVATAGVNESDDTGGESTGESLADGPTDSDGTDDESTAEEPATDGEAAGESATDGESTVGQTTPQSPAPDSPPTTDRATETPAPESGSLLPGPVAGLLAGLPNPLALWPGGLVGTVLGALVGLVVVVYGVLKALAIYLGY